MVLETALVTLLAPVLPALIGAGQRIGQDAASAVGAEAADLARRVWDRLQGSLAERPTASSPLATSPPIRMMRPRAKRWSCS